MRHPARQSRLSNSSISDPHLSRFIFRHLALLSILLLLGVVYVSVGLKPSRAAKKGERAAAPQAHTKLQGKPALDYLKEHGIYDRMSASIEATSYEVGRATQGSLPRTLRGRGSAEVYTATNSAQNLNVYFSADRVLLQPLEGGCKSGTQASLQLRDYGYGSRMLSARAGMMRVEGNRMEIRRELGGGQSSASNKGEAGSQGKINEWYLNNKEGIEQGFTLDEPPGERQGEEPLRLRMSVTGKVGVEAVDSGKAVALKDESGEVWLRYDHLMVKDARGHELPARLEAGGREISVVVDDADAVYPVVIDPVFKQIKELSASDAVAGDQFGEAVSISGDTVVVGAFQKNSNQGAAYIFSRNQGGTDNWGQVKKLTASDAKQFDGFGIAVAISGDTVVIGARGKNSNQGAAYIFSRNQGGTNNWGETKKLIASDAAQGDLFGSSVVVNGDTVLVGAPNNNSVRGAAYVYYRNQGGTDNWGQVKKLTASDAAQADQFGNSISISGDTVVVGAYQKNLPTGSSYGAVYIYSRNQGGADNWGETKKLTASDAAPSNFFGNSVSISGDTVVVGAPGKNFFTGAAYIYSRNQGGDGNWGEVKKLTASDAAQNDQFGSAVSINVDTLVVGAWGKNASRGAVYVYYSNQGGAGIWGETKKLTASDAAVNDVFGASVSISGDTILIGAGDKNSYTGAAYVFDLTYPPTLTKLFGASSIQFNGTTSLTFTITNPNPSKTLTGVGFTDTLPSGLVVADTPNASNTCGSTFNPSAGDTTLSLSGGSVLGGQSCTLSVNVKGTGAGLKNNTTSTITSNEGGAGAAATASVTVQKGDQTITVNTHAPSSAAYNTQFTVAATASSGLPVTYSSSGSCTNVGATFTVTSATGTCTVMYDQAGDNNYNAATQVIESVTTQKAAATVSLSNLSQTYDGTAKFATATTNPSGKTVIITYSQNGSAVGSPTNAGSYDVSAVVNDPNYQGSTSGILIINKATPVITWNNPSNIASGTALSAIQLNATANVPGTFQYNPLAGTVLSVGINQLSVTFTPNDTANYTTATKSVQLTVDPPPALSFSSATYSVSEDGGNIAVIVNRIGDTSLAVTVDYATSDTAGLTPCNVFNGVASSRCDYATTVGTLRFDVGESSKTIFIPIVDDGYVEGAESFTIKLSNPSGINLGSISSATITITDNDTATSNPIVGVPFFIRQQYIDFLGREPDPVGFQGWQDILNNCPQSGKDSNGNFCDRIAVSSGFFRSPEFQDRGYFVFRFYPIALGRNPSYAEFMPDLAKVSGFLTDAQLETNKVAFVQEFISRSEFQNKYGALTDPTQYVDALLQSCGLPNHPSRITWINGLTNQTMNRAQVLRALAESSEVYTKFYNTAFVVMQYFGYLRRDPDILYLEWIKIMDQNGGDYRAMISGFMNSPEYFLRFGP